MLEFRLPIPVETPLGQGLALYVVASGAFANDVWCVALEDRRVLHFLSSDLKVVPNGTWGIK